MYDPELYRSKQEVEEWKRRDPIPALSARLGADGLVTPAELDALGAAAEAEVAEAVTAAEAAPWEPVSDLARDVHGEGIAR
jgi:TPP-dependent pyruvate/acetoin dehydrogenase alpha subunit